MQYGNGPFVWGTGLLHRVKVLVFGGGCGRGGGRGRGSPENTNPARPLTKTFSKFFAFWPFSIFVHFLNVFWMFSNIFERFTDLDGVTVLTKLIDRKHMGRCHFYPR